MEEIYLVLREQLMAAQSQHQQLQTQPPPPPQQQQQQQQEQQQPQPQTQAQAQPLQHQHQQVTPQERDQVDQSPHQALSTPDIEHQHHISTQQSEQQPQSQSQSHPQSQPQHLPTPLDNRQQHAIGPHHQTTITNIDPAMQAAAAAAAAAGHLQHHQQQPQQPQHVHNNAAVTSPSVAPSGSNGTSGTPNTPYQQPQHHQNVSQGQAIPQQQPQQQQQHHFATVPSPVPNPIQHTHTPVGVQAQAAQQMAMQGMQGLQQQPHPQTPQQQQLPPPQAAVPMAVGAPSHQAGHTHVIHADSAAAQLQAAAEARRYGKRELSTSRRAEQNRNAQRAFRQRKEMHIRDLEQQVAAYETMKKNYKALQEENYQLREYIISLQSRLLDAHSEVPEMPNAMKNPLTAPPESLLPNGPGSTGTITSTAPATGSVHAPHPPPASLAGANAHHPHTSPSSLGAQLAQTHVHAQAQHAHAQQAHAHAQQAQHQALQATQQHAQQQQQQQHQHHQQHPHNPAHNSPLSAVHSPALPHGLLAAHTPPPPPSGSLASVGVPQGHPVTASGSASAPAVANDASALNRIAVAGLKRQTQTPGSVHNGQEGGHTSAQGQGPAINDYSATPNGEMDQTE